MTSTLADPAPWFTTRPLADGVYVLSEPGHVNSFLVLGDERALLFDTGMGIGSILGEVRTITDLPLLVVNSHHHFDHRGGNAELAPHAIDIAVHPAGVDAHGEAPAEWHAEYEKLARRTVERFGEFARLDYETFFTLTGAQTVRPIPDLSGWRIPATRPTRTLADGELLDLGGRVLRVLHSPGHSPDGLCLWDETTGSLLAGDTLLAAAFWAHFPESDIAVFAGTTARLAELPTRQVLVAHNLRCVLPGSFPAQAAEAFAAVRDGRTRPVPYADPFGNPLLRHDFDGFAIFSPEVS
ncbi:MBL fold metallo-hydrolase [Amycolatopsis cynarae]|uniref:MBL fold metallo-hydrolase n=1 Tax=Amycolatopsis cynarae TaxID=2995223 RepID=A0ABY7AWK8_9PSEU|nr:MBL fold metallo-hydrolase [Amycolatopsis sp. HUAS 11-8]WAL64395.1 MBL fold metallo-hydrolase [Amycolatopsis sp. HUAS 11-8]